MLCANPDTLWGNRTNGGGSTCVEPAPARKGMCLSRTCLDDPVIFFGVSLAAGAACAAAFMLLLRARTSKWVFLILALLAVASVYAVNPTYRIASVHGFYHSSIVYQMLNGKIPPQDPLAGDATLSYPWAAHAVVAGLVWTTGLPVSWAFAFLNLAALAVALMLFYAFTRYFFEEPGQRILATAMAFFGVTFLPEGLYSLLLEDQGIPLGIHGAIPIIRRFSNMSAMSVGVMLFVAYALVMIRTMTADRPGLRWYGAAFGTVFLCGALYPFALVAIAALGAGAGMAALATNRKRALRPLIAAGAASALGAVCGLPLLLEYMSGRTAETSFLLTTGANALLHKAIQDSLLLWPVLALMAARPGDIREWYGRNLARSRLVLAACIILLLLHLLVSGPDTSEAKWRAFAFLMLAIAAAAPMHKLVQATPLAAGVVLCLFFSLAMGDLAWKLTRPRDIQEAACEKGRYLHPIDPREDALYTWIADNTPTNALLMDTNLNACVFGRRALYVAMPTKDAASLLGWTYSPQQFMQEIHGHEPAKIQRRRAQVNAILSGADTRALTTALTEAASVPRPLFIVCHSPGQTARLETLPDSLITKQYDANGASVFELQNRLSQP